MKKLDLLRLVLSILLVLSFTLLATREVAKAVPQSVTSSTVGGDNSRAVWNGYWKAQTFKTPATPAYIAYSAKIKAYKYGSPGTITASLRSVDGSGIPTGPNLVSGNLDANTFTTSPVGSWYEIVFSSNVTLATSTTYSLVLQVPAGNADNEVEWIDNEGTPPYSDGNMLNSDNSGSSWTSYPGRDALFEIMGNATAGGWGSGTGRVSTFVLATSDAPSVIKAQADATLDGVSDNGTISSYLSLMGESDFLTIVGGNININGPVILTTDRIHLDFQARLVLTGASAKIQLGTAGHKLRYTFLKFQEVDGIDKTPTAFDFVNAEYNTLTFTNIANINVGLKFSAATGKTSAGNTVNGDLIQSGNTGIEINAADVGGSQGNILNVGFVASCTNYGLYFHKGSEYTLFRGNLDFSGVDLQDDVGFSTFQSAFYATSGGTGLSTDRISGANKNQWGLTDITLLQNASGTLIAAPGVNYVAMSNVYAVGVPFDKIRAIEARVVVNGSGNELGNPKGVLVWNVDDAAGIAEATWASNTTATVASGGWATVNLTAAKTVFLMVKGSSATENITLNSVHLQILTDN